MLIAPAAWRLACAGRPAAAICSVEQRHAERHQPSRESRAAAPRRRRVIAVDPGLVQQRPRLPGEEGAEQRALSMSTTNSRTRLARGGRRLATRLDADVAALRLHPRAAQERDADQQEHRRLVLPVGRPCRNSATHAVGQHQHAATSATMAITTDALSAIARSRAPASRRRRRFDCAAHPASKPWLTRPASRQLQQLGAARRLARRSPSTRCRGRSPATCDRRLVEVVDLGAGLRVDLGDRRVVGLGAARARTSPCSAPTAMIAVLLLLRQLVEDLPWTSAAART